MEKQKKKNKSKTKKKNLNIEDEEEDYVEEEIVDSDEENITKEDNFVKLIEIEELSSKNVNNKDIEILKSYGFATLNSLVNESKHTLLKKGMKGMNDNKIEKILTISKQMLGNNIFLKGTDISNMRESLPKINPGCESLKNLLRGGFEIGTITEIYGEFRTGKTQLCLSSSVYCQLPKEEGGLGKKVIYIDTENTFRHERITSISEKLGLDPKEALENIFVTQIVDSDNLLKCLDQVGALILEEKIGLIVEDSIMNILRGEYSGRGELSVRQNVLCIFLKKLTKLAWIYKLVVLITNQMVAQVDGMGFGDNKKPIGGHIMAHASATRLYLRKGRGDVRICKIVDSPFLPESEASFLITEDGIENEE